MAPVLRTASDTLLKRRPLQLNLLQPEEKYPVEAGREFVISGFTQERNHIRFSLLDQTLNGFDIWYAFGKHVEVLENGLGTPVLYPKRKPRAIQLEIPYKSQLDNWENPTGSSNVTSVAMCLEYFNAPQGNATMQFEDELYRYAITRGLDRHNPEDLAKIVRDYGCQDDFRTNATIEQVQDWLADCNPAIAHGYFTAYGHVVAVVGYDTKGFYVHDPYGEWSESGYRTDKSGAYIHYSYRAIRQLCMPDGNFWVHFISK